MAKPSVHEMLLFLQEIGIRIVSVKNHNFDFEKYRKHYSEMAEC
jgi:hypothetical protein